MNSKSFRMGVGILALALVSGASAQSLSGVSTKKLNGGIQVQIEGQDLGQPKTSWSKSKSMFFLTFDGKLDGRASTVKVGSNGVNAVSWSWADRRPAKVRVALNVTKGAKPELVQTDGLWAVNFNVGAAAPAMSVTPKYPENVPPIQFAPKQPDLQANNNPTAYTNNARVDLDFVNTDIVQILKALALQANVNIVTSPDVNGKITVTLEGVSVKDALDIVTALGGVRYAKIGNTFVVTSNSRFSDTITQMVGKIDLSSETRVIPLFSGEGSQIKAAVLKTINSSTINGRYDLLLPSDKVAIENKQNTQAADTQAGDKGNAGGGSAGGSGQVATTTDSNTTGFKRDDYIVIAGTPGRLDEIEKMVRAIDTQICAAMGIKVTEGGTGIIQRTYEPKGISAEDLLKVLKDDKTLDFGNVKILATPKESMSRQAVVLSGRASEVENLLTILQNLDSMPTGGPTFYEVVELSFIKPQVAAVELMGSIYGLKATILPSPVEPLSGIQYTHNALFAGGPADQMGGGDKNSGGGGDGGSGGGGGGGNSGGGNSGGGNDNSKSSMTSKGSDKTTMFSADVTTFRTPMKVLLRGTREQIERGKQYLAMVDLAPKQVAVEVRVMDLSKEDALKVGIDWSLLTGGSLTSLRINQGLGSATQSGGIGADLGFKGGGTASITGMLDSIANKGNLLARPNILLTDGVLSKIFVGDRVNYVKSIQSTQNGVTVVTDYVDVGVDFTLAARVGAGGNITLDMNPVLSILKEFTNVPGGGQLPQTSVRSANTSVQIKSGETIAIGGLITDQDRKSYSGIPILKDLPLIGHLFGRTNNVKSRSEVVFFVTVKEVTHADRQGAANPNKSVKDNTEWPGNEAKKNGNGKGGN